MFFKYEYAGVSFLFQTHYKNAPSQCNYFSAKFLPLIVLMYFPVAYFTQNGIGDEFLTYVPTYAIFMVCYLLYGLV